MRDDRRGAEGADEEEEDDEDDEEEDSSSLTASSRGEVLGENSSSVPAVLRLRTDDGCVARLMAERKGTGLEENNEWNLFFERVNKRKVSKRVKMLVGSLRFDRWIRNQLSVTYQVTIQLEVEGMRGAMIGRSERAEFPFGSVFRFLLRMMIYSNCQRK